MSKTIICVLTILTFATLTGCKVNPSTVGTVLGGVGSLIGGIVAYVQYISQNDSSKERQSDKELAKDTNQEKQTDKEKSSANETDKEGKEAVSKDTATTAGQKLDDLFKNDANKTATAGSGSGSAEKNPVVSVKENGTVISYDVDVVSKVEYRHFKDQTSGFSFDYLYAGQELKQEKPPEGSAYHYYVGMNNSSAIFGLNFYGPSESYQISNYIANPHRDAFHVHIDNWDAIDYKAQAVGNNGYLMTCKNKAKKMYIVQKGFFVKHKQQLVHFLKGIFILSHYKCNNCVSPISRFKAIARFIQKLLCRFVIKL